ncbi:Arginyl-tRNA--protein transferase 1 [Ciborinia camelliae]|nr:Arginyl-tRNA--protein transferase 1 [Ciborinia camelliae]
MQTPVSLLSPLGFSYYARTQTLQPEFYQGLLDRGWRRSGTLLYKPDLRQSCCPQYTIRLDSHQFHATKDQRQVLNRFNRYILGDAYIKEAARLYPKSREEAKKRNTDFNLRERIHEGEKEQIKTPPEPAHTFTVTLETDDFTEEKYSLFENYQRVVHHEPPSRISKGGFKSFLCSSPLPRSTQTVDGEVKHLGSYHQCYRLDGKLIAIGTLDLLPKCVSAVYFMYDESVHSHGFGKLGALREIALAKEKGYQYWYAGFYIHNCVKMRYKGDYSPQYLLDPETYSWILFDSNLRGKLDAKKFVTEKEQEEVLGLDVEPDPEPSTPTQTSNTNTNTKTDTNADDDADADDDDDDDDDSDFDFDSDDDPDPDYVNRTPIFQGPMPGLLSTDEILTQAPLDHIKIRIGQSDHETNELMSWERDRVENPACLKGVIAELVSAVGWGWLRRWWFILGR